MFGFVVVRHVRDKKTNAYWLHSVACLRRYYPECRIVIVDDNSDPAFLSEVEKEKGEKEGEWPEGGWVRVVQAGEALRGRGELLGLLFYLSMGHEWFPRAFVIHDSVFAQRRLIVREHPPFAPLFTAPFHVEDAPRTERICLALRGGHRLLARLLADKDVVDRMALHHRRSPPARVVFGVMGFMSLQWLRSIDKEWNLGALVHVIRCRADRCALERVWGLITLPTKSVCGDIYQHPHAFHLTWEQYKEHTPRTLPAFAKVWTGR